MHININMTQTPLDLEPPPICRRQKGDKKRGKGFSQMDFSLKKFEYIIQNKFYNHTLLATGEKI